MSAGHQAHETPPTTCATSLPACVCVCAPHPCPCVPSSARCHGGPSTELLGRTELYLYPTTVVPAPRCYLSPSSYAQPPLLPPCLPRRVDSLACQGSVRCGGVCVGDPQVWWCTTYLSAPPVERTDRETCLQDPVRPLHVIPNSAP